MTLPEVQLVQLDNGFRALLVPRSTLPVVASVLWYRVGSRDERTGETGVSHFLEHMMFKGTDKFGKGQIDLLTSKMGGSNNAFTDNDGTAYYFAMAADRYETVLEIEASRMTGCLLDPLEFASEKNVVLEELAMGEDDPWRPLYQACESLLYQVHPYHHPVIGWKQDLESLTVAQMRDYYQRNYGPGRAFLVLGGAIDTKRAQARIEELFGSMPAATESRRDVLQEPAPSGERRAVLHTPHTVKRMCMAFPTCKMGERHDYALDIVAHALGGSRNSRLYKRLVLKHELVTDVSVVNETRSDPGALFVLCELREGVKPHAVEAAVKEEIEGLQKHGVDKSDLKRIREQIRASFLFQDETVLDQALKIARFEAMAPEGYRALEHVLPTYASITNAEVKETAGKYLQTARSAVVWALPSPAPASKAPKARGGRQKSQAKSRAKQRRKRPVKRVRVRGNRK
jgi:zinc protease